MVKTEYQNVRLPKVLLDRLTQRQHPHQSVAGVIEELLDAVEHNQHARDRKDQYDSGPIH